MGTCMCISYAEKAESFLLSVAHHLILVVSWCTWMVNLMWPHLSVFLFMIGSFWLLFRKALPAPENEDIVWCHLLGKWFCYFECSLEIRVDTGGRVLLAEAALDLRLLSVLVSCDCCNKLLHTLWLKQCVLLLKVLQARSLKNFYWTTVKCWQNKILAGGSVVPGLLVGLL
jgi:hypothetical protein